jgi:hypothetical protein
MWPSISLIRRLELVSAFDRAVLRRFSTESSDVLSPRAVALPPLERLDVVERRAVVLRRAVQRRAVDERPLALRPVLLRAVVLRAPPVLRAVLRVAVLRAAGDISLLSLGGRWGCLFHTADANASCNSRKHVERKLFVEARRQLDVIQRDPFVRRVDQRRCLEERHCTLREETIRDAFGKCFPEPMTVREPG